MCFASCISPCRGSHTEIRARDVLFRISEEDSGEGLARYTVFESCTFTNRYSYMRSRDTTISKSVLEYCTKSEVFNARGVTIPQLFIYLTKLANILLLTRIRPTLLHIPNTTLPTSQINAFVRIL